MRTTICTYGLVMAVPGAGPGTCAAVVGSGTCRARTSGVVTAQRTAAKLSVRGSVFIALSHVSFHLLDVRQYPGLVEKRLFRAVQTEEDFEIAAVRRHPVRVLACGRPRAEEYVQRAVGILLHAAAVRRTAGARRLADQRVRLAVVRGGRPVQLHRRVRRDVQPVGLLSVERLAGSVVD